MSNDLDTVRNLLLALKDEGYEFVCVGGAARDTFLGRTPKDYDCAALKHVPNVDDLKNVLFGLGITSIVELGGEELAEYENGEAEKDRGLEHVLEFSIFSVTVQLLMFSESTTKEYGGDPYMLVEDHDCDLNKAWFEEVNGALRVRVHGEFPSPHTGNVNNFRPGYSDHVRKAYISQKFPEFNHK